MGVRDSKKSPPVSSTTLDASHGPTQHDVIRGSLGFGRETVESLIIAFTLALLFRAFEAEAFVIPTGSMAPTLMGRHKDLDCSECDFNFQAGASREEDDQSHALRTELGRLNREIDRLQRLADDSSAGPQQREVARQQIADFESPGGKLSVLQLRLAGKMIASATCPNCGNVMKLIQGEGPGVTYDARYPSYNGDRILVDKFAYDFREPNRWDVVVFKYPEGANTNYIKRLVGLPNELVSIAGGDIWTSRDGKPATIARKPPHVMQAMLQVVEDNDFPAALLQNDDWPSSWTDWAATSSWQPEKKQRQFSTTCPAGQSASLRYQRFTPTVDEWKEVRLGMGVREGVLPKLVKDFQAYNAIRQGSHWVGDLAVECMLQSSSPSGRVVLDLIDGGQQHSCSIDLVDGTATLTAASGVTAIASTPIRGNGSWTVMFSNVDDELRLFIDGKIMPTATPVVWGSEITAEATRDPVLDVVQPGSKNLSDLAPVGITVTAQENPVSVTVSSLKILRDIFYIGAVGFGRRGEIRDEPVLEFPLEDDQFFVLGDNSAASKDGRLWIDVHYVDRRLLLGRAISIFWPHMIPASQHITVTLPVLGELRLPSWPNFARMKFIR
ncbi:MAG: signal peptidase I [Planctomycetaceae bacterium]|nr:signal peptidase I [Planctomycetaceae bacterium]